MDRYPCPICVSNHGDRVRCFQSMSALKNHARITHLKCRAFEGVLRAQHGYLWELLRKLPTPKEIRAIQKATGVLNRIFKANAEN